MKGISYCILAALLVTSHAALADSAVSTSVKALSAWTNEKGSTLYIDSVGPNGQITGHYVNRARGYNCQNIPYPVTGWVYGTAITFATTWRSSTESCNSITSWTGFFAGGQITTLWQLVPNGATSVRQIAQGSDVFKPSPVLEQQSLIRK